MCMCVVMLRHHGGSLLRQFVFACLYCLAAVWESGRGGPARVQKQRLSINIQPWDKPSICLSCTVA